MRRLDGAADAPVLAVTLNLALDVTYRVDGLVPGSSIRVRDVRQRAGGKGVNVARVLHALGVPAVVTGFVGGATGRLVRDDLDDAGIDEGLVDIDGETRRTVAVVDDDGVATMLLEPGPVVSGSAWAAGLDRFRALAAGAGVVVLSGSLPSGLPDGAYAELVAAARAAGRDVVLDTSGDALLAALAAGPTIVKPNREELVEATGGPGEPPDPLDDLAAVRRRADVLRSRGAGAVVVSLGGDGLLADAPEGAWHACLPAGETVAGNPTGAGDAVVAALVRGLLGGTPWPDRLRDAVALSAAAVLHPVAGGFDAAAYRRLLDVVEVRVLPAPEASPANSHGGPACR